MTDDLRTDVAAWYTDMYPALSVIERGKTFMDLAAEQPSRLQGGIELYQSDYGTFVIDDHSIVVEHFNSKLEAMYVNGAPINKYRSISEIMSY